MSKKANFRWMVVAIIVVLIGTGSVWANLTDGLVAHWTFDEGTGNIAHDSVGTNNGTFYGEPNWIAGKEGSYALSFDGVNDYVRILRPVQDDFTIALWLKSDAVSLTGYHACHGNGIVWSDWSGDAPDMVPMACLNNKLAFGTGNATGVYDTLLSNSEINTGQWVHAVVTRVKSTGEKKIYINGEFETSQVSVTNSLSYNPRMSIGGNTWDNRYFNGIIDDVYIYNRALSAEEVAQLYCGEQPNLVSIVITGSEKIAENSQVQYKAIAYYDNNSTEDVTDLAAWSVEPDLFANIEAGLLNTDTIDFTDETITISAQYSEGNDIFEADKKVTIFAICPSGNALEFDGVDDYVEVADNPSFDVGNTITLQAWIKTSDVLKGRIISCQNQIAGSNVVWGLRGYSTFFRDSTNHFSGEIAISNPDSLNDNRWHYVVGTLDATQVKIYIDGTLRNSGTFSNNGDFNSRYKLTIGNYDGLGDPTCPKEFFCGTIDEVAIYNRALSAEEIYEAMHNKTNADDPNLIAYWDLDEGEGQIAYDASGNGNGGILGSSSDVDNSDPNWIESTAPIGTCTPMQMVNRNITDALEIKSNIQHQLDVALRKEQAAKITLDQIGKECPKCNKKWLLKANLNLLQAIWNELWSQRNISESIKNLQKVMELLNTENPKPNSGK